MKLKELFTKDIDRNINGVIKADQTDDASKWVELDEYVITREVDEHLRKFFDRYEEALDNPNDPSVMGKVGVWITGFFGSGKSHFIKMLSYLLENKEVTYNGITKKPVDFFADKIKDELWLGQIKRAVAHDTDVILFNIDSKAQQDKESDAILSVFQNVFNEKLGYSKNYPYIAEIERFLDHSGKLNAFKQECLANDFNWDEDKESFAFYMEPFKTALSKVLGQSESDCDKLIENYKSSPNLTVEGFAEKVKEYLDRNKNKRIIFLVDEIGQFIGQDTKLMLNLQTITENLGTICGGRAWIVVTSQQEVDAIIGDLTASRANDFSKITGRFNLRLALSSANTDEVIKKRLLHKKDEVIAELSDLYKSKGDIIKSQTTFSDITKTYRQFNSEEEFIESYPFLPYQYDLVQRIFESIRKVGVAGLHLARGERSMLDSFQQALCNVKDNPCDCLIPLYDFYPAIKSFLETDVIRTIEKAASNPALEEFDVNLLKVLFLIRHVDEMKGTLGNLVVLCIDKIDTDKVELQKKIQKSLDELERQNLINHNGNHYYFLTNEEQNVAREIKRERLDPTMDVRMVGQTIFDDFFSSLRKHRYKVNGKDFAFSVTSDEQAITTGDELSVKVITCINPDYDAYTEGRCVMDSSSATLLIRTSKDDKILDEVVKYLKTENYIKSHHTPSTIPAVKAIYENLAKENIERKAIIKGRIKEMLLNAQYYACGRLIPLAGTQPLEFLNKGLDYLIGNVYTKLGHIQNLSSDPVKDIKLLLKSDDTTGLGLALCEDNRQAMDEVRRYISLNTSRSIQLVLKDVIDHFAASPYGWPDYETVLILTRMYMMKEINFIAGGDNLSREQVGEYLTAGPRKWTAVTINNRQKVDAGSLQKARQICRTLTGEMGPDTDEDFQIFVTKYIKNSLRDLDRYQSKIEARSSYPGAAIIKKFYPILDRLVKIDDGSEFVSGMLSFEQDIKDFAEDFEDLQNFYEHQIRNWDYIENKLDLFETNSYYLDKTSAKIDLARLKEIVSAPSPYGLISEAKDVIDRIAVVQEKLLQDHRESAEKSVSDNIEVIKEALAQISDADLSNKCLMPIQNLRKQIENETNITRLDNEYPRRAGDFVTDALENIRDYSAANKQAGKPELNIPEQASVDVKKCMNKPFLKTKEDVREFLAALEKELNEKIDNNQYIQFK